MGKRVRLADVARAAGVSQGTASNAFSRPELVRPEVRERVAASAAELGYAGPDPKGRLLRAGKVNAIGVVVSEKMTEFFDNPYNREFMAGIAEVCDEQGAGISLISAIDERTMAWSIDSAVVDGFILQCIDGTRLVDLARKRKLPFVSIDAEAGPDASSISIDDRSGARDAALHLIGLGHRRFGILSLELADDDHYGPVDAARRARIEYQGSRDRLDGFADALATIGVSLDDVPIYEVPNESGAAGRFAAEMLEAHPGITAILATSDLAALGVMAAAQARGLSVPGDLSVTGFDDVPEARASTPPLSTVHQPIAEKGRRAAHLILSGGAPAKEILPVQFIARGSTGPAPR